MRLFYALWPDDGVRNTLAAWQHQNLPGTVRHTHVADLHLTLRFLGQVEPSRLSELRQLGDELILPEFELQLDRLGHWPRPAVLWAGPQAVPERLRTFHEQLENALEPLGFTPEGCSFRPHVTLARKIRRPLETSEWPPIRWHVREWALVQSRPGECPLYHPLERWLARK